VEGAITLLWKECIICEVKWLNKYKEGSRSSEEKATRAPQQEHRDAIQRKLFDGIRLSG
jgi:hypothetical protein